MEGHLLRLDLPVFDVYLVSAQHNGDVVANSAVRTSQQYEVFVLWHFNYARQASLLY